MSTLLRCHVQPSTRTVAIVSGVLLLTAVSGAQEGDLAGLEERAMMQAVERVASTVVRIDTVGGLERVEDVLVGEGPTTGLVVSADGYVISSAFNFIRQPSSILVTLPSGRRAAAEIVSRDHSRMLILLKVSTDEQLVVPEAVPLDQMHVGQWTIAVGRTLDPQRPNMSIGILSAKDRIWGKAIQTDANVSPNNYGGPLIDLHGRVLGVLVPMSPDDQTEVAGNEWYDSGIGFAVPLADVQQRLERLKQGQDIMPGLLGITLKGGDIYSTPAELAACQVKSPAYEAGLRAGDVIVELEHQPIIRQAQLKHALGPRYGGEQVRVVVTRGTERIEAAITLAERLIPYEHPFLGILPQRDAEGVIVRYVYPGSGAAQAGIQPGDRITRINQEVVDGPDPLRLVVANLEPGQQVAIEFTRDTNQQEVEATLGPLPTALPEPLPPARARALAEVLQPPAFTEIKILEEPNECLAFVPRTYRAGVPHGVIVYLRPPGAFDRDDLLARWHELCEAHDLILLAPQPRDSDRWTPMEIDFIRKTVDHALANYNVDKNRLALVGRQAGGALAYLFAFRHRELARGVVAIDAAAPFRVRPPDNDPVYRLAIFSMVAGPSRIAERVNQGVQVFRQMKYPVTFKELDQEREPTAEELQEIVRWIDALDRI